MKITNNANYPRALYDGMVYCSNLYDKGDSDFSATELIQPLRIRYLKNKHYDEIVRDVSDLAWSVFGTAVHWIVQQGVRPGRDIGEKRFFVSINGQKVSAQIDLYEIETATLSDYKCTKAYAFHANQKPKPEWVSQLNIQKTLMEQEDIRPKAIQIIGFLRDHDYKRSQAESGYPKSELATLEVPIFNSSKIMDRIKKRMDLHNEVAATEKIPLCSREETWNGIRCARFCEVSNFCSQYKEKIKDEPSKNNL